LILWNKNSERGRAGIWTRLTFFDVPPGRHVDAGLGVQAHGKTASGATLAAVAAVMVAVGGRVAGVAQKFQAGQDKRVRLASALASFSLAAPGRLFCSADFTSWVGSFWF
jgi:hypothetical protein